MEGLSVKQAPSICFIKTKVETFKRLISKEGNHLTECHCFLLWFFSTQQDLRVSFKRDSVSNLKPTAINSKKSHTGGHWIRTCEALGLALPHLQTVSWSS